LERVTEVGTAMTTMAEGIMVEAGGGGMAAAVTVQQAGVVGMAFR
jgi:hypothetical protein